MEKREERVLCRNMTLTEREKLIEILSTKIHPREGIDPAAVVADFLLDHDVLPVVRCAACQHRTEPKRNKADDTARGIATCGCTKSQCYGRPVYPTDFCSFGAREEDA